MLECSDLPLPHSPFLLLPKSQPHPLAVDVCDNPPSPAPYFPIIHIQILLFFFFILKSFPLCVSFIPPL